MVKNIHEERRIQRLIRLRHPDRLQMPSRMKDRIYAARKEKGENGKTPTYKELAERFELSQMQVWYVCNALYTRRRYLSKRLLPFYELENMHFNDVRKQWEAGATLREMAAEFNCRVDSIWRCVMILTEPTGMDKAIARLETYNGSEFYNSEWNGRIYRSGKNPRFYHSGDEFF